MPRWQLVTGSQGAIKCRGLDCTTVIGAGEPYATVTIANVVWCQACVKQKLGVDPPADVWGPEPETDTVPDVVRDSPIYRPPGVRTMRDELARDGKLAQLNEEDQ